MSVPAVLRLEGSKRVEIWVDGVLHAAFDATGPLFIGNTIQKMQDTAGAVNGSGFVGVAGSPGPVGARALGGDYTVGGGDARGDAGGGAAGGGFLGTGGVGSSGGGAGGLASIISGNGGAGGGASGDAVMASGIPQGAGAKGRLLFYGGGIAGGTSVLVGYFAANGQFHVGADADVANTNLRVNGLVNAAAVLGGAGALPALPAGYISVNVNGAVQNIPFYN